MKEPPLTLAEIRKLREIIKEHDQKIADMEDQAQLEEELAQIPTSGDDYGSD